MNAVRLHQATGPAGLIFEQIEVPSSKDTEVLVRVHAASITRDELDWPVNRLPAIPSYEFSGVVADMGPNARKFAVGEEVYALSPFDRNGSAAEYIVLPEDCLAHKPKTLDHVQCSSIPLAALTAWQGLFDHGKLQKGQRVLLHGATGGVGHFGVQLARHCGAYVIGTVSTRNIPSAQVIGMDEVIDDSKTRFEEVLQDVDLVFDTVGGDRLKRSVSVVCRGGRLISVAAEPPEQQAEALGIHALYFIVAPNSAQLMEIAKLVDDGLIQPKVDSVFPLSSASEAFERSLVPHGTGKIVLRVIAD